VQQVSVRSGSDEVLPSSAVVKGYEYEKNQFVAIEAEELKTLTPKTSAAMEIQEFVQLAEIDPVYFETSYYVTPEEAGEKAYALLYRSLQITGLIAIAQFAMHSREHVVVVRPGRTGLLAHTMFYASEVRADEEYRTDVGVLNAKELELAQTLIHSLSAPFEPTKYHDTYRERLEEMLSRKVKGLPVTPLPMAAKQAEVVDIADALRRSLAALKKPASSEKESKQPARTKKARGSS
jgi:DNA end-binding protein Ku